MDRRSSDHEIAFREAQLAAQSFLRSVSLGALNLIVIIVESHNIGASKFGNLPCRTSDTTADIQNVHSFPEPNHMGEIMFMTSDCLIETFTRSESTEMEGRAPAVFIQIGCKVIVAAMVRDGDRWKGVQCSRTA